MTAWPPSKPLATGRIARGIDLLRLSWGFLREQPRLLVLPALSTLAMALTLAAFDLPALYLGRHQHRGVEGSIAGALPVLPLTFISVFFSVAFLEMVRQHVDGEPASVRAALRIARRRLRVILAWALLTTTVGVVLRAIGQIPLVGGWLGGFVSRIAGLAWSLATFFVVPVLAVEGLGPIESIRRSASVFRERWGESVTGDLAIDLLMVIAAIPGAAVAVVTVQHFHAHEYGAGLVTGAVAAALLGPVIAIGSALQDLFSYFLYRQATEGVVVGPFSAAHLESAMQPKKHRFWQIFD